MMIPRVHVFAWLLLCATVAVAPQANSQTILGTAQTFAVLGGSAVTNTGASTVSGNLGVGPGTAISGFPPGLVSGGTIHAADAVALQAQSDTTTAFNILAGEAFDSNLTGTDLGGLALQGGVYRYSSSAQLTGTLTLDAQGDPNALFVFQIGSTLTTGSNASVSLINGAQACNVFWKVGSSATLGTNTDFVGNILALTSITMTNGATLAGRALARSGAVSLDDDDIAVSTCDVSAPITLTLSEEYTPPLIIAGGTSYLVVTITNTGGTAATLSSPLVDTLPMGMVVASSPDPSTTCAGSGYGPVAGSGTVMLPGGYVIPANGSCEFRVRVTAPIGRYTNILPVGALQTDGGSNAFSASATLVVASASVPVPTLSDWMIILLAITVGALAIQPLLAVTRGKRR